MLFRVVALIVLAGLSACATAAKREGKMLAEAIATAKGQANACMGPINSDPTYSDLARHAPLANFGEATISQLTDPSFATQHEVDLASERHDRLLPCLKAY